MDDIIEEAHPNFQGLNTSYAIQNKFICYVPLANALGPNFKNLELNIARWTLPHINVGSTSINFKGYTLDIPTRVLDGDSRELELEYIVDSEWYNYSSLYFWAADLSPLVPVTPAGVHATEMNRPPTTINPIDHRMLDIRIWLLSPYKKRIMDFVYHDAWISQFSDIALDVSQTSEIKHSFTCKYSRFTIEKPNI